MITTTTMMVHCLLHDKVNQKVRCKLLCTTWFGDS